MTRKHTARYGRTGWWLTGIVVAFAITLAVLPVMPVAGDDEPDYSELVGELRDLYEQGEPLTLDEEHVLVADEVPGFAGFYLADDEQTTVIVLAGDASAERAQQAAAVLTEFDADTNGADNLEYVTADYGWHELFVWMRTIMEDPHEHLPVVFYDIDEVRNRIAIGVEDSDSNGGAVREHLRQLGVPGEVLIIEDAEPIVPDSLRIHQSTLRGGLYVRTRTSSDNTQPHYEGCTLGLVAQRNGVKGYISASHCTERIGGSPDNFLLAQWSTTPGSGHGIGNETRDGQWLTGVPNCTAGRVCRYGDINFFTNNGVRAHSPVGYIAWPSAIGDPNVSWSQLRRIIGRVPNPAVGRQVAKVGASTGRTSGWIQHRCINFNWTITPASRLPGSPTGAGRLLCQTTASYPSSGGDSGSPVFRRDSGQDLDAHWYGIHAGRIVWESQNVAYFAPPSAAARSSELGGTLRVCHTLNC